MAMNFNKKGTHNMVEVKDLYKEYSIKKRGATYVTPPIVFFPNLNQDTVTKILH